MKNTSTKLGLLLSVIVAAATLGTRDAAAFPSIISHGYTTCVTCHQSPSGGGLLTSYGKYIAGELFGKFNTSADALPWVTTPKEDALFHAGFLGRTNQYYFNTPMLKRANLLVMQADIEAGLTYRSFFGFATVGPKMDSRVGEESKWTPFIRRFYVGSKDINYAVRVGKFFPEFGINHPNHNVPTRKSLYFNHNEEPYLAQGSWYSETFEGNLGVLSGASGTELDGKKGFTANVTYKTDTTRSGVSYLRATQDEAKSEAIAFHTQLGYFTDGYTLAEWAVKRKTTNLIESISHLAYFESGYEISKGIIPYLSAQYNENVTTKTMSATAPSLGVRLYPITHFELIVEVGETHTVTMGSYKGNGLSLFSMLNVYF